MAENKAVAPTSPREGDALMSEETENDFIKIKEDAEMPEASNTKKGGLFSVIGRVGNTVGATWTSMKEKDGAVGSVTRTADGWFSTVYEKGKEVDGKLGVSDKVKTAAVTVKDTTVQLNEKLHVTETVKGVASSAGQTVGQLNEKFHVSQTVKGAANTALGKVSSLDQKLGVSSTLQSGVDKGLSAIFGAARPGYATGAGQKVESAVDDENLAGEPPATVTAVPTSVSSMGGDGAAQSDEKPKTKLDD